MIIPEKLAFMAIKAARWQQLKAAVPTSDGSGTPQRVGDTQVPRCTSEQIRTAFDRSVKALTAKPWIGRKTYLTKVCLRDGFTCDIEEGPWTLTTDLGKKGGGNETGPTPGMLARAALGSCVAMCYVMWAAKLEVPLSQVEVDIEADTDLRGMYGVAAIPAGYTEVRYRVTIESSAASPARGLAASGERYPHRSQPV